jgi:hypothetical protein
MVRANCTCVAKAAGPASFKREQVGSARRTLAIGPSFRLPEGDGPTHGVNAALVGAMYRAGVTGHVIAGEKQLGERIVFG